jgi:gliding motility-associated protein GldL
MSSGISKKQNRLLNVVVCLGAAIVIVGALFKIMHYPGSDYLLPIGLITEAGIFVVYAILPPPDDHAPAPVELPDNKPKVNIDWDTFKVDLSKMSGNFQKLGSTVDQMKDMSDMVKATGDFSAKTKDAASALGNVAGAVTQATASLSAFNSSADTTKAFHEQVKNLTGNLTSLNGIYELELKESNNHLKAMNSFYGKVAQTAEAMQNSAADAMKAKEQIAALANNLGKLNQVYGNMLSAMQGRA